MKVRCLVNSISMHRRDGDEACIELTTCEGGRLTGGLTLRTFDPSELEAFKLGSVHLIELSPTGEVLPPGYSPRRF